MGDNKQLFLLAQLLPGNDENLNERLIELANNRNRNCVMPTKALEGIPACEIIQMAVGPHDVALLFKDNHVARLHFSIVKKTIVSESIAEKPNSNAPPSGGSSSTTLALDFNPQSASATSSALIDAPTSNSASSSAPPTAQYSSGSTVAVANAAANRTAKIRRVMMAARRPGGIGGRAPSGVVIDRARPLIPASSVPEELVAQAQVVLQGKSREVIVKELQRTNLNVNEAVNNLLSRDDDEGDDFDDSEAYLHEELLSLLDAGLRSDPAASAALMDHEMVMSTDGYEYLISRDLARRQAKSKDRSKENTEKVDAISEQIILSDSLQHWGGETAEFPFPHGVNKFLKIASMNSELIVLADNGLLYSWNWDTNAAPLSEQHGINLQLFPDGQNTDGSERIIDIATSAYRCALLTSSMRVGSFMDSSCGKKMSSVFFEPLIDVPNCETVEKLFVSTFFTAVYTNTNSLFWRGIYPFNERRKIWEKARTKNRKHVTFQDSNEANEIVVGAEVRTKSSPIYSAGSVAVNFSSGVPLIGTLNESAWTLNETCRFKVLTPDQYDNWNDEKVNQTERKVSFNISIRKRAAPSSDESSPRTQEGVSGIAKTASSHSAWPLKDVIFIKEESVNDTGIVKLVDGAYCGIVYRSTIDKRKSEGCDEKSLDISSLGLRILRKDDLIAVSQQNKATHSPDNFQTNFQYVKLPSNAKVLSMAVDTSGFRVLVDKRGRAHLLRINCFGKLLSDHMLPIDKNAMCKQTKEHIIALPSLENYGDDSMLVLRDSNGSVHPLVRNALGGFREFSFFGLGSVSSFAVGMRFLKNGDEFNVDSFSTLNPQTRPKNGASKGANRLALISLIVAPSHESAEPKLPSLMHHILLCDLHTVRSILGQIESTSEEYQRNSILEDRIEGNRTIFHVAIMNCFAKTNRNQADSSPDELKKVSKVAQTDTTEAESVRKNYDKKWQKMVGSSGSSKSKTTKEKDTGVETKDKSTNSLVNYLGESERQANAIEIVRELIKSPAVSPFFVQLMQERDINGLTPFQCAIQYRAYTSATLLWNEISESITNPTSLSEYVMPTGTKPDDSPLFTLCYNDTCSYTWTGDDHVKIDIFECRTCGLLDKLCCCTECAYTCHRNHDCTLKKTSPTAYCDCWEKCACRALVSGNSSQREFLLNELIQKTKLIDKLNSKGQHLLMLLVKTVGRQIVEQECFVRRVKIRSNPPPDSTASATQSEKKNSGVEHDLEPPRFARRALEITLGNWSAVKSLLEVGVKKSCDEAPIVEDLFHLNDQNGSTHLDKFVFALLVHCQESHLDILLNVLVTQANKNDSTRYSDIDSLISRFVRSVVRIMLLVITLSPTAASLMLSAISASIEPTVNTKITDSQAKSVSLKFSTSVNTETSSQQPSARESSYRAVAISGMLSLVRASLPISLSTIPPSSSTQNDKKRSLSSFISKSRRIFQVLISYSICELLNSCDALIAPVRLGMVKPSFIAANFLSANDDVLELIERYLNSELDLTTLLQSNCQIQPVKTAPKKFNTTATRKFVTESDWSSSGEEDDDESIGDESSDGFNIGATRSQDRSDGFGSSTGFRAHLHSVSSQPEAELDDEEDEGDEEEEPNHMDDEEDGEGNEGNYEFNMDDDDDDVGSGLSENPSELDGIINNIEDGAESSDTVPGNQEEIQTASAEPFDYGLRDNFPVSPAFESSAQSLSWAVRRVRHSKEPTIIRANIEQSTSAANANSESTRETIGSSTAPTTTQAQSNTGNAVSQSSRTRFKDGQHISETNFSSTNNTATQLAMCFSMFLKLVDELILQFSNHQEWVPETGGKGITSILELEPYTLESFKKLWNHRLIPIWQWFALVMDRTEAKLKFGNALTSSSVGPLLKDLSPNSDDSATISTSNKSLSQASDRLKTKKYSEVTRKGTSRSCNSVETDRDLENSRADFFSYCLSLLRSSASENGDDLPVVEYNALKSITFIAEAYIFHLNLLDQLNDICFSVDDPRTDQLAEPPFRFYQRSKSLCYPYISAAKDHHAFQYAANECLPLSTRPQLLQAYVDKEVLFSLPTPHRSRLAHIEVAQKHGITHPTHQSLSHPPTKYEEIIDAKNDNEREENFSFLFDQFSCNNDDKMSEDPINVDLILGQTTSVSRVALQKCLARWSNTFSFLGMAYHDLLTTYTDDNPGLSVLLNETGGFSVKSAQLRRHMERFRATQSRDLVFSQMSRDKYTLLSQTLRQLDQQFTRRQANSSNPPASSTASSSTPNLLDFPPLASHKVKVTFRDEPGEGTGVARSFYAAIADAFLTCKHLPLNLSSGTEKESKGEKEQPKTPKDTDVSPLFYKASKFGYYAPISGSNSQQRLNAFRNVGRMIGICLQQMEVMPFHVCRHVFKFILGKPITWFDLAFYDPSMFDSLRSIVHNEETNTPQDAHFYEQLQLTFSADIPGEEGGGVVELKAGGENIPVTRENVLEYIYLFVEQRLLGQHVKCLEAIRRGVFDVIPPESIAHLAPEDLRLILCGIQEISISLLQSYTKFSDESSAPAEVLSRYKQQFWSVVNKFTNSEKQELIFFWTGSPTLPSTEEGWQPLPTVMLRPADDNHLPTANTCISRLYVPLYSSRKILRAKLLLAIKARNFGFV